MNCETISLAALSPGEVARVVDIAGDECMRRRLLELGMVEGTTVRCVGRSPAGDPVAYLVRGAVVALRRCDGATVAVQREGDASWG